MTLPAALQARLKRRGLVVKEQKPEEDQQNAEQGNKKKSYRQQPLPPGWFKVPDAETSRDYFWNVHTNQVSWRHPNDPRADITYPACWQNTDENEKTDEGRLQGETRTLKSKVKVGKHPSLVKAQKHREKGAPYRKGKKDEIDPMDPASYSDIGRGTWSSGLREDTDVKTGVDTTANGPLFQQRPYPSPGDILRRNRKPKDDEDNDEDD